MRVSVFGLGYVGCVTASCVSRAGHEVIGVDIDAEKVAAVNAGTPPVVEPGLGELLAELVGAHRLRARVSAAEAVRQTDVGLICVGTPGRADTNQPHIGLPYGLRGRDPGSQSVRPDKLGQELTQPRLHHRRRARIDSRHLFGVNINADHLMPRPAHTGSGDTSHVAEAEHANAHDAAPPLRTRPRTLESPATTSTAPRPADAQRSPAPAAARDPGGAPRLPRRSPPDRPREGSACPKSAATPPLPRSSTPRPSPSRVARRS